MSAGKYGVKLNKRRKELGISIDTLAKAITMRAQTTAELLSGKIKAPEVERRMKAYKLLKLTKAEIEEYEDIACEELGEIPEKFIKYLRQYPAAREAIRLAMESNEGDDMWVHIADMIKRLHSN